MMPGMADICNPSTWETESGGSQSGNRPGLHSLKQKNTTQVRVCLAGTSVLTTTILP